MLIDIALALLLLVVLTPAGFGVQTTFWMVSPPGPLGTALLGVSAVLLCAAVALMRLSPALALAAAWAGALAHMASGAPPVPVNVAILLVLFATAAWGSTAVFWAGLGSAIFGALVAVVYLVVLIGGPGASVVNLDTLVLLTTIALLALGLAWTAGLLWRTVLRARGIRQAQERAETRAAEEQERVRIARDMHDIVAHSLAVVIAQADGARYAAASDPDAAAGALSTISQTSRAALSDVRMLLTQLRHRQGDGPQPTLADLETLFEQVRQTGLEPRVVVDPAPTVDPPAAIQLAVYRVLQEALTNAIRHGEGGVDVSLAWHRDRVDLTVSNRIAVRAEGVPTGHGLVGMRERAELVGGSFEAESGAGVFTVRASLPWTVAA